MSTQVQLRRGTTADNENFTGAQGELTMDTDTNGLRIHDGTTQGGFSVPVLVSVQRPTAENNYTWWRKYSDGWVQQGGFRTTNSGNPTPVALPVPISNPTFIVPNIEPRTADASTAGASWNVRVLNNATYPITADQFFVQASISGYNINFSWTVGAMAA